MNIIPRIMHGVTIGQRKNDGYLNATAMSKAHFEATGQRREASEWLSNKRTKESLEHLSLKTGIPVSKLIITKKGKPAHLQGIYIHPRLAVRFGIWLSDEFGYAVEEWFEDWVKQNTQASTKAESDIELLDKVIQMLTSKTKVNTEAKFLTSFYDILYRKRGGEWTNRDRNDRPGCVGGWTNAIIYDRLPGGDNPKSVKAALKAAQQMEGGRMHYFLTSIGQNDLGLIFNTLRIVDKLTPDGDWDRFMRHLSKALPNGEPLQLSLLDLLDEAKTDLDKAS